MSGFTIRPYQPSDGPSATRCLLKAFDDDPLFRWTSKSSRHGFDSFAQKSFSWLPYMLHASYGMTEVAIDNSTGEVICLAGWEPPNMTIMMLIRGLAFMCVILFTDGFAMAAENVRLMTLFEGKRHKLAPKAHHLQILGAKVQGKGVGSKLIRIGLERADKAGVPCYLESSNPKNIPFYKRHGFVVCEEVYPFKDEKVRGPVATLMKRLCQGGKAE